MIQPQSLRRLRITVKPPRDRGYSAFQRAARPAISQTTRSDSSVSPAALRHAALNCLRRWQADADMGNGAMAVVMAGEWVQNLALLERDLEEPMGAAVEAARKPWWR